MPPDFENTAALFRKETSGGVAEDVSWAVWNGTDYNTATDLTVIFNAESISVNQLTGDRENNPPQALCLVADSSGIKPHDRITRDSVNYQVTEVRKDGTETLNTLLQSKKTSPNASSVSAS